MTTYDSALAALADPTRRSLLERLRDAPSSVGELTRGVGISQPAVSQHLRVLERAKLVAVTPEGARRIYRLNSEGLEGLRAYIDSFWQDALGAFQAEAQRQARASAGPEERRGDEGGDTSSG